jgi:histidine triad (HIT) family protein
MSECIFCSIASGNIPSEAVYQDETVFAFKDIHPKAPVHVLIIPKKHINSLADIKTADLPLAAHMLEVVNQVSRQLGIGKGYKLVINTGAEGGQAVMHLHMHLLGGKHFSD